MTSTEAKKDVIFLGNSRKRILGFPDSAQQRIGTQIKRLQRGLSPTNFKPIKEVGPGTYEIRISASKSWFRVFYVTKVKNAIYVLHAFEKKSNAAGVKDIKTGRSAYKELLRLIK